MVVDVDDIASLTRGSTMSFIFLKSMNPNAALDSYSYDANT